MSRTTSYLYDLSGNVAQKRLANGLKEVRVHDGRNRVTTLRNQTAGSVDVAGYGYGYDRAGNVLLVGEDYPSGSLAHRTIINAYDGVNRLLSETITTTGAGAVTTTYVYDKGHNRSSKSVSGVAATAYVNGNGGNGAGANQIVSETTAGLTTHYQYDGNGNRTSKQASGGVVQTGNVTSHSVTVTGLSDTGELTVGMTVSGWGIAAGTLVAGIASSTSITLSAPATGTGTSDELFFQKIDYYSYDNENRLTGLNYQTGGAGTAGTYGYRYDYRTRRVARTRPGPVTTNIAFDGGTSILEYGAAGAASPNVEYIRGHDYGGGVGGLEYSVRSGTASFNSYDSRGDVTTKTNGSGTVTWQTAYEAFGRQTATSGLTQDRQKANTKEQDPTGLLNEGFRYRDPATGTFLTRDPLGFKAGPNMYTYVHQNPWTHFDPEGLMLMSFGMPGVTTGIVSYAKNLGIFAAAAIPFAFIGVEGIAGAGIGLSARTAYLGLQGGGAGVVSTAISSGLHGQTPTLNQLNTGGATGAIANAVGSVATLTTQAFAQGVREGTAIATATSLAKQTAASGVSQGAANVMISPNGQVLTGFSKNAGGGPLSPTVSSLYGSARTTCAEGRTLSQADATGVNMSGGTSATAVVGGKYPTGTPIPACPQACAPVLQSQGIGDAVAGTTGANKAVHIPIPAMVPNSPPTPQPKHPNESSKRPTGSQ